MNDKTAETVTIGCRIPNGYILEVGLQTVAQLKDDTTPMVRKLPNYKRIRIGGTHDHTLSMRLQGIQVPSMLNAAPFLTRGVPKDLWEQWKKEHPGSWAVESGNLFEVRGNERDAIKEAKDVSPAVLQPLDPTATVSVGSGKVEKADFVEK